ncbi:hypothetical protein J3U57_06140 [Gilliamella sp. B3464]|uniref:hypothetical protein n=1 Tax=unclassified Gilliamella TaxID=2685620 RepID=UPI00226AF7B1|nr:MULTISPECIES: hypothetical protein [unclassified Gilliamella]MCX8712308.1 hypothetical protein [Gilliamella sp. B3468]MCX8751146.1 hypothetical protein [Gilliamella sp. B3464]
MSILDILIFIAAFIITLLLVRGIVIRIYAKFKPLRYIKLTVIDEKGIKNSKKLYINDEKLLDDILEIRRKQKLAQGLNCAK